DSVIDVLQVHFGCRCFFILAFWFFRRFRFVIPVLLIFSLLFLTLFILYDFLLITFIFKYGRRVFRQDESIHAIIDILFISRHVKAGIGQAGIRTGSKEQILPV